ncbi:TPA: CDP-glycerol glycerophosphotransferase family protein, partial [Streptococcus suis]|nr:CDP-glycerol glycerophosphotransferase family protein [Streptococcus suis]
KNKYVLINRFHPGVADHINIVQSEFNKDGNFYSDMQELLVASDVLITDFSSSIFDFVLKSNKVFLFAKDYDDYINKERGLNFDLKKDLKFNFANSQDELIYNILNFNEEIASNNIEEMKVFLGMCDDGNASLRIAEHIMNIINES